VSSLNGNYVSDATVRQIDSFLDRNKKKALPRNAFSSSTPDKETWEAAVEAAIQSGDAKPWNHAKLMVVGQGVADKTSTVRNLLGLPFKEEHESTILAKVTRTRARNDARDNFEELSGDSSEFDRQVLKSAADRVDRAKKPESSFSAPTRAVKAASKRLSDSIKGLSQRLSSSSKPKEEESDDAVRPEAMRSLLEKEELAQRFKFDQKLTALANFKDIHFMMWDYGGQEVFYALHHIFLTKYGLYLAVFDMQKLLENAKEESRILRFWLNSIKLHAPSAPILIIGTRWDKVSSLDKVNNILATEEIGVMKFKQVILNTAANLYFFPLDNKGNRGGDVLRQKILEEVVKQDYIKRPVPLSCLKIHEELTNVEGRSYFSFSDVVSLSSELGLSGQDTRNMLALSHELGVVVHLRATDALSQVVLVEPQWLLDKLGRVIADDIHIRQLFKLTDLRSAGMEEDLHSLRKNGLASKRLLEYL